VNSPHPTTHDDVSPLAEPAALNAAPTVVSRPETPHWSIQDLLRADAFPHAVHELQLRETHISWVVLTGSFAYKIKKAVKLDFIDASTLERRRHHCAEEIRLNRRLAPDLYLGVVAITLDDGRAVVGGAGPVVDYAVRMRQFAASEELPALLARNDVDAEQMAALGQLLAEFHLKAMVAPAIRAPEKTEQIQRTVLGNLHQLLENIGRADPSSSLDRLLAWTRDTARELEATFQLREREGHVREGHGDLHAANIVRHAGRLVPFDCIEFDPRLRWIDTIDDIAFLVMDLMSAARSDLATALLSRYLEVTGDYAGLRVLPFYATHRALVRANVDALTAVAVSARATELRARLQQRLSAATSWTISWTWRTRPKLILMHGASGSGKSWLSSRLIPEVPALRIRSDLERKRLAHLAPTQSSAAGVREGIYSPGFSHRTYGRLAECAEHCLRVGCNVIVDASFLQAADREMFNALAIRLGIDCVIVSCQSDPITLSRRVIDRATQGKDPSDSTLAVLDAQLRELVPFAPHEKPRVITIDTQAPHAAQRVLKDIRAHLT